MKFPNKKVSPIDLFAGAGGMSLGFENAGFEIPLAVEIDDWAVDTYRKNRENSNVIKNDILEIDNAFFKQFSGIDAVIGGPPCQGFSISASNRRNPDDPRNYLYRQFLRVIKLVKPRIVFMENVKEIVKFVLPNGKLLLDEIIFCLEELGYSIKPFIINAADFGIPQERIRFFMVASLGPVPDLLQEATYSETVDLLRPNKYRDVYSAISDLPAVYPRQHEEGDTFEYDNQPVNNYQRLMRKGSANIYNHIPMRHTDRTIEKFKMIRTQGIDSLPENLRSRTRGDSSKISNKTYSQNHRRINPTKPSPTITASFYSSFIHPYQDRNLTVREAARIQSFPDNYIFYGKRTTLSKKLLEKKGIFEDVHLDQFNQVGNAVPPLLAEKFASIIIQSLKGEFVK
uniref:Cytosine-specific methyltransferase n=1 Tax=Bacillus pumilus TaxID=1408 RepID=O52849_BACPU|nr:Bpu10I (5m)cytosine-specific DNA modification methyltransferase (C1) [Bacillus pumilus]